MNKKINVHSLFLSKLVQQNVNVAIGDSDVQKRFPFNRVFGML